MDEFFRQLADDFAIADQIIEHINWLWDHRAITAEERVELVLMARESEVMQ